MAAQKGVTLFSTEYPPYGIYALGDCHLVVAGGGGQAKTGVPNAIVCFIFIWAYFTILALSDIMESYNLIFLNEPLMTLYLTDSSSKGLL